MSKNKTYYGRSAPDNEIGAPKKEKQLLKEHLNNVAFRCGVKLVDAFDVQDGVLAYLVGQHHDDGKYQQEFQVDVLENNKRGVDHSSIGAAFVRQEWADAARPEGPGRPTSLSALMGTCIANHHSDLPNYDIPAETVNASNRLTTGRFDAGRERLAALDESLLAPLPSGRFYPSIKPLPISPEGMTQADYDRARFFELRSAMAWYTRFLFGALHDADVEDARAYERPSVQQYVDTLKFPSTTQLITRLDARMQTLWARKTSKINKIRNRLWSEIMPTALQSTGVFRMSLPTGSGKTLLSAGWGLRHIEHNKLRRLIYVMPYTAIVSQNAEELRLAVGKDAVLEHQSDIKMENKTHRNRKTATNWNSPVVVTTTLQLFESLRSAERHRLRKLPAIPKSLIIMDEAQALDPALLDVTIDSIKRLLQMGCSVMFMTATQPALERSESLPAGLDGIKELVDEPQRYVDTMRRVRVDWGFTKQTRDWMIDTAVSDEQVWRNLASWWRRHKKVLIVGSTRNAAKEIYNRLPPRGKYHLSRRMCSAHIRTKIDAIKAALERNEIVRVASTNLIEAGVDLDFPVAYRMFAGLDSFVQLAGRVNREGRMSRLGTLRPFFCPIGPPAGSLTHAVNCTKTLLEVGASTWDLDIFNMDVQQQYFLDLYRGSSTDLFKAMPMDADFRFEDMSWLSKWIKNTHMVDIVVPYGKKGRELVELLATGAELSYSKAALIPYYTVSVYPQDYNKLVGLINVTKNENSGLDVMYMDEEVASVFYSDDLGLLIPEDFDEEIITGKTTNK